LTVYPNGSRSFVFRNPQHGVRGRRRVDRTGRMVRRPSDLEIASQSAIRNALFDFSRQRFSLSASPKESDELCIGIFYLRSCFLLSTS
jgi:hypothetical protein